MKKIMITMIAIAFSLSAFSQITKLDVRDEITVWCIDDFVFVSNGRGGLVQIMDDAGGGLKQILRPLPCRKYQR